MELSRHEIENLNKFIDELRERAKQAEAENAALRERVAELMQERVEIATKAESDIAKLTAMVMEYLGDDALPESHSVGAGGSVYPFGGRETETR